MSQDIRTLEPKKLWDIFYSLTQVPRPSRHEGAAIEFIENFGHQLGLETLRDEIGNVIIRKPATPGMEDRKTVVLQGHMDMVPQKNQDKQHDFNHDPIEAYAEEGWVKANGTTLGADNGIGVAAALAILKDTTIQHGPLEALFTMDEESGMTGANHLKPGLLNADILLNLDSEDEGELYVGCAGGSDATADFTYMEEEFPADATPIEISLTGLRGGHSGMEINMGRGNANKLLIRLLKHLVAHHGVRLSSFEGGNLRNAIPREAIAVISLPAGQEEAFNRSIEQWTATFKSELSDVEPNLSLKFKQVDQPLFVMDMMTQDDLINAVQGCPNGVIRMSTEMEGLVETSINLAVILSKNKNISVRALIRSSVDTAKADVESTFESIFRLAGAHVRFDGAYPGWKPNMNSEILRTMQQVYESKWGKIPQTKAIHAGLECGILGSAYPHWDMISFGPTIRSPHSPDEKVNIESVAKFWDYLVETLKHIPKK